MFSWLANAWRCRSSGSESSSPLRSSPSTARSCFAPGVDSETIENYFSGRGGTILGLLDLFSGGALALLFALGIMPYVTASIILQLMTVVIPRLAELQKEGGGGLREDHPVHALPHGRARGGEATGYAFLFKNQGALEAGPASSSSSSRR